MTEWVILEIVGLDIPVQRPIKRLDDLLMAKGAEDIRVEVEGGAVVVVKLKEKLEIFQVEDLR